MNIDYVNGSPYLPGAASLIEDLDKRVLLVLRDGRHLIGVLRSFDQYVNLVLEETFERVLLPGKYCDVPLGLYIVRGDNIVLMGDIGDLEETTANFVKITPEQLSAMSEQVEIEGDKVEWDFD